MNNIQKITENVPIFGTTGNNAREHRRVMDLNSMAETGVNFTTYNIREGETLFFPAFEDMHVEWVAVAPGSTSGYHIVKCMSEYRGVRRATWFSLASLYKRDIRQQAVQPTWYDLGDNKTRLQGLAEMGSIHGEGKISIDVPVFEDGRPVEGRSKPQTVVLISPYKAGTSTVAKATTSKSTSKTKKETAAADAPATE